MTSAAAAAVETVLLLLACATVLAVAAQRTRVAPPIVMVIGGLALAFVPGLPRVTLEPDLVFALFLPPLLFAAAFQMPWEAFRFNLRPILLLAVGLVLATATAVAFACQALFGWPLAVGFVLGAIISPPDAVAATAVAQRLSIPRRVVTVLEGESLINDATGLVLFKFAVTAVVTGGFSIVDAGQTLAITAIGGVAWGLAVGWIASWLTRLAPEWDVAVLAGLLTPFVCYLPAEHLGLSGVLATVAGGLLFGRRSHDTFTPTIRLKAWAVWEVLLFLLNGLVFVLIGLQLPAVLDEVAGGDWRDVATATLAVVVVVIAVRMVWIFPSVYLPRWLSPALAKRDPAPPWRVTIVIGWAGMRGIVSLAAALALPQTTADGGPFPNRDLILFFAFAVILATLVVQGLTLPPLIRRLGLIADDPVEEAREAKRMALEAALLRVQLLGQAGDAQEASIQLLRERYRHMLRLLDEPPERVAAHARVVEQAISVEREVLRDLLRAGVIDDTLFRELERDLDHQHARLEGGAV